MRLDAFKWLIVNGITNVLAPIHNGGKRQRLSLMGGLASGPFFLMNNPAPPAPPAPSLSRCSQSSPGNQRQGAVNQ